MAKNRKINVQGNEITIIGDGERDYILYYKADGQYRRSSNCYNNCGACSAEFTLTYKSALPEKRLGWADFPLLDKLRNETANVASAPERKIFI